MNPRFAVHLQFDTSTFKIKVYNALLQSYRCTDEFLIIFLEAPYSFIIHVLRNPGHETESLLP